MISVDTIITNKLYNSNDIVISVMCKIYKEGYTGYYVSESFISEDTIRQFNLIASGTKEHCINYAKYGVHGKPSNEWGVFYFLFKFTTYILIMNNEQKAEMYNQLMYEYTKTQNQISSIKGESINLNESQLRQVRELENKLRFLMDRVSRL